MELFYLEAEQLTFQQGKIFPFILLQVRINAHSPVQRAQVGERLPLQLTFPLAKNRTPFKLPPWMTFN
jgi:hypothetical protein